jgi:flavodoxin
MRAFWGISPRRLTMNALVAYYSESDNTRKLADALAAGLGTRAVPLDQVSVQVLSDYDLICIGTPVQGGRPARKVREFIARMPMLKGTRCAGFCTMHAFGDKNTLQTLKKSLEARGMIYLGGCSALGWSRLVANFGPRIFNRGRPNPDELARATELGRTLRAQLMQPRAPAPRPREAGFRAAPAH